MKPPYHLILCIALGSASIVQAATTLTSPDWTFRDNFEDALSNQFWQSSGVSAFYGAICPVSESGGHSLVFEYVPDEPETGHGWAEWRFNLPINAVQLEMSYDLYIPTNYYRAQGNHKNFVLWSGDYGKSKANVSVSSESWPKLNGATPSVYIGVDGVNHGHSMARNDPLIMKNGEGRWINIRVVLSLAEKAGAHGVFELYRDGKIITGNHHPSVESASNMNLAEQLTYAKRGNYIDQGYLMGWANGGFSENTIFCIDNFYIGVNETHKPLVSQEGSRPKPPAPVSP